MLDRNRSTSGPTPWKIYDDDYDEDEKAKVWWGMCDCQLMPMDNVLVSYLEGLKFIMCDTWNTFLAVPHHLT